MIKIINFCLIISFVFVSGCWDRIELNDRAIWLATAWDLTDEGEIQLSGQIAIPANMQMQGDSTGAQPYFIVSGKGRNVGEASDNIQKKLPRKVFLGQRRVVLLSEEFAKHAIKEHLDNVSRTPLHSLRGAMFVVKGTTAKNALLQQNPLEKLSAIAILNEHRLIGGRGDTLYLQFLISSQLDGIYPTLPILEMANMADEEIEAKGKEPIQVMRIAGVALFDRELKLKGILGNRDNRNLLWIMGMLKKNTIIAEHEIGNASINLYKISSKIKPKIDNGRLLGFTVYLHGTGSLEENNSSLDERKTENVKKLEKAFQNSVKKQANATIKKVQEEYGLDIFGFGEVINRKNPQLWDQLKDDWDETFRNLNITVEANIKLKEIGLDGPSILFRRSE